MYTDGICTTLDANAVHSTEAPDVHDDLYSTLDG